MSYIREGEEQYWDGIKGISNTGVTCWWASGMQLILNMPEFLNDIEE